MRKETFAGEQPEAMVQENTNQPEGQTYATAFEYLKSLPRNLDRPALESYKRARTSAVIDCQVAEDFTDGLRNTTGEFYIPVSWTLTKTALLNLLGITSHQGYPEVNGVRFYGGLNGDNYLTLIAVSTTEGMNGNDDLTVAEEYPYYDYADMCPSHCSSSGNLRVMNGPATPIAVSVSI